MHGYIIINSHAVWCYSKKEWSYRDNYLLCRPDEITPNSTHKVWWKCKECGYIYKMAPKTRAMFEFRHRKSCPRCKGLRRKKHYIWYFWGNIKVMINFHILDVFYCENRIKFIFDWFFQFLNLSYYGNKIHFLIIFLKNFFLVTYKIIRKQNQ